MIKAVDLRRGIAVKHRQDIWIVVDFQHVAKGNKRSLMQVKLKNLSSGTIIEERFRVSDTLEDVFVDKRQMEYSYSTSDNHFCMDSKTYEQVPLKVAEAPPTVKGATATNQSKTAKLETGITVEVPPFVEAGEIVRVDTRSGEYVERVRS